MTYEKFFNDYKEMFSHKWNGKDYDKQHPVIQNLVNDNIADAYMKKYF